MKRILSVCFLFLLVCLACKRNVHNNGGDVRRPKLVVGLVIDQMRWDYLYRFYSRYGNDGFKRLLNHGFSCENTMLPYIPANTAPGHACIYTGSVPSIHGIAGNNWIDMNGKIWYCVDDSLVYQVGDAAKAPSMSPRTLLTTTITDELRLATNQRSRVYGIAIKDRGAILPAGHLANGAYWYNDRTGEFVTSTYYPNQSPAWLQSFNKRKVADSLAKQNWKLLYAENTYTQSTVDANNYEKGFKSEKAPVFPHTADTLSDTDRVSMIKTMPQGNTLTFMMARACMDGEKLGQTGNTDFLAVSLSSTDYVGHQFGPNSLEIEDMYLRLDKEIAEFLSYLDSKVGKGNYLLFLSADHGGAHNATFLQDLDIPAGVSSANIVPDLNAELKAKIGKDSLVIGFLNNQVFFNEARIAATGIDRAKVRSVVCNWFNHRPEVAYTIDMEDIDKTPTPQPIKMMMINGYNRRRSGSIQVIFDPGWYDNGGRTTGMTHGSWNPYDTHVPLLWYGWHIPQGHTNHPINSTDISATLAALLHIQMPNGCVGHPIPQLTVLSKKAK